MTEATAVTVVANPLSQEIQAQIAATLVDTKAVKFSFRKAKDAEGKDLGEKSKRPTLEIHIPMLTKAGLIAALEAGDKSSELALECANDAIINRARGLIQGLIENDIFDKEAGVWKTQLTPDMINLEDLSFFKIAMLPKSERGSGIDKDSWAAFVANYISVMQTPEAISAFPDKKPRDMEILKTHGIILGGKFNAVRSRKDVIKQMLGFLDIWLTCTKEAEEHQACYEYLVQKGNALMEAEDFNNL